jgi:hypothetical protein
VRRHWGDLQRGLQQALHQRVLHFLFSPNSKKVFGNAFARA